MSIFRRCETMAYRPRRHSIWPATIFLSQPEPIAHVKFGWAFDSIFSEAIYSTLERWPAFCRPFLYRSIQSWPNRCQYAKFKSLPNSDSGISTIHCDLEGTKTITARRPPSLPISTCPIMPDVRPCSLVLRFKLFICSMCSRCSIVQDVQPVFGFHLFQTFQDAKGCCLLAFQPVKKLVTGGGRL